jgi:transposase
MIDVSQIKSIRTLYKGGHPIAEIARNLSISEPTVRKSLTQEDFNQPVPALEERPSKLDEFKPIIERWLAEDAQNWHKQRHSAVRIHERLQDEYDFSGSYSLVQRFVKKLKQESGQEAYLDLVWPPAEAQVDFGQADFDINGTRIRMHYLVVTFPYSNVGIAQVFYGETAECVCEGLKRIFIFIGGVPKRIIFDNATGVGRKICDAIRLTELFARFQMHFDFEVTFCNPDAGHEKGNVENKIGKLRRSLFVPIPNICDLAEYNEQLFTRCLKDSDEIHYRKGERCLALFEEDCLALTALPATDFNVVRYETLKTDKKANLCIDGKYWYSTAPKCAHSPVIVGFGAFSIDIYNESGALIASHDRLYGEQPQESIDPAAHLRLLLTRPGAWLNSSVRFSMPEELRTMVDEADKDLLKEYLTTLIEATDATDYKTALEAAYRTYRFTGNLSRSDVTMYAMRLFDGCVIYDEPTDLAAYDGVFADKEVPF